MELMRRIPKLATAVLLVMVATYVRLYPRPKPPAIAWNDSRAPEVVRAQAVQDTVRNVEAKLRLSVIHDSLLQAPRPAVAESALVIRLDQRLAPTVRANIERALRERWSELKAGSRMQAVVAIVVDTTQYAAVGSYGWRSRSTVFVPANASEPCISILRIRVQPQELSKLSEYNPTLANRHDPATPLLGACPFFSTYGMPGAQVHQWLATRGWDVAREATWSRRTQGLHVATDPDSGFRLFESQFVAPLLNQDARYVTSPTAVACVAGHGESCREAMSSHATSDDPGWTAQAVASNVFSRYDYFWSDPQVAFGPFQGAALSQMVRSLGVERFGKFWSSNEAPESAFAAAAGRPLEDWTREWAHQLIGEQSTGPSLGGRALLALLVTAALALAGGVIAANRRRVA